MDIKVDHVSKAYGEQQILRDLCCVFPEGKTTCIRGRSGCGKTTLIRLLLGLDIPDKGKIEGISDRKILEMAKVFRVNLRRQIRYIYVSQVLPYFLSAFRLSLGMCWKAGVAAEVIGVPSGSIGEKLYNAKIYLNTPDLFAWTIVIIVISFVFEKCFLGIVSRVVYMIEHK